MNSSQYAYYHETKAHTSEVFPYNTYLCSIPLDFTSVKLHWHDEIEFIAIKKGEGIVSVNLVHYNVKAGDVVFVFPGQLHSIRQKGNSSMEYENILFREELLSTGSSDLCQQEFMRPLFSGITSISPVSNENSYFHPAIMTQIENIGKLCSKQPYGYQLALKGCLFHILFLLTTNIEDIEKKISNQKSLEKVKSILAYIEEHYTEPITIEDIASHCLYSKSYFMKFFKETMGMGFIAYLNDYRLEIAAKMLLESSENVLEIAEQCGFDNLSYFNRCFKRKYGMTPGKYRK